MMEPTQMPPTFSFRSEQFRPSGHLSIRADQVAVNNGLAPATTMAASGAWKGRVVFTIWSPAPTTFGTELLIMNGGYTEISLEKQMNANVSVVGEVIHEQLNKIEHNT